MRLISKDLGKLTPPKSNGWILSYDQNTDPKEQIGGGPLMSHFPQSGVLLFENWILREILLCESHALGVIGPPARGNLSICAQYLRNFEGIPAP